MTEQKYSDISSRIPSHRPPLSLAQRQHSGGLNALPCQSQPASGRSFASSEQAIVSRQISHIVLDPPAAATACLRRLPAVIGFEDGFDPARCNTAGTDRLRSDNSLVGHGLFRATTVHRS